MREGELNPLVPYIFCMLRFQTAQAPRRRLGVIAVCQHYLQQLTRTIIGRQSPPSRILAPLSCFGGVIWSAVIMVWRLVSNGAPQVPWA